MAREEGQPFIISDKQTQEVLAMRKIELLLDVLVRLEESNSPDVYGVKINVIDKIDRAVNKL